MDLALNNLQYLICHKTKPNQTKLTHRKEGNLRSVGTKVLI